MMESPEDPILRDFPDQFETERLVIRPPRSGDGPAVNAAIRETFDALKMWMPWAQTIPEPAETEATLRRKAAEWQTRKDLMVTLWRKSDGLLAGCSGLHRIDWSVPCVEIGYWLRTSLQGQGYMTEAVLGLTKFAFEQLGAQRIEIRCDVLNTRSAAVAERAGYTLEARLHHHVRGTDGGLRDTLVYVKFPPGDGGSG
jgi:RimJ/RimL family protein N-acetyltransferase